MSEFTFETWDDGRLLVNGVFVPWLEANRLTTFDALMECPDGVLVRRAGPRATFRVTLPGPEGRETVYVKRHDWPALRDWIRPLLHLSLPIVGARNEWESILRFHAAGIPTVEPVALGVSGGRSLLVTRGLNESGSLLDWVGKRWGERDASASSLARVDAGDLEMLRTQIGRVADIARRMHAAGLHHQDFYLNHLLLSGAGDKDLALIDLGRARQRRRLGSRWVVKDLAQLDFSARRLPCRERLRFLRHYLGRPLRPSDKALIRRIAGKSRRIAAHTRKHRL